MGGESYAMEMGEVVMARIVKTRIEPWDAGMFPVMTGKDYGREEGACVPLSLVLPHERQADRNHGQTLHRLAERGGLSACELAAVLEDREWHSMPEHEGWAAIFRAAVKAMPTEELSLTAALDKIEASLEAASEERYQELKVWEKEAWKWKAEGDGYGWNFHTGMAAGANWCDIFYRRIGRTIKELRKAIPSPLERRSEPK